MESTDQDDMTEKVKALLAENLGVGIEDISQEDFFSEDLHMAPDKLADFVDGLGAKGFETAKIELTELETVDDLIEALSSGQDIN
jgi:acyl carrier protein